MWYVYVIKCSDGSLYTGITKNVQRRVEEHNRGEGAKYTRGRTPVELEYFEECENRSEATIRENEIKDLSKSNKEKLIK